MSLFLPTVYIPSSFALKICEKAHNHCILFKPGVLRDLEFIFSSFPCQRNGILTRLLTSAGQAENTSAMLRPELAPFA